MCWIILWTVRFRNHAVIFIGRDKELEELYTMLEENRHVFLCGIAGIGKSELAKAYAKHYKKHYTNILYVEYTGDLHQDITDMDFIDDPPEISEQERFQRHNRFLRSLKSDTLLIIDNFNVTATQDSFLSVVLKYRCQILFTTRSNLNEYCTFQLKEIKDINILFQLTSAFYSEADKYRSTIEKIIETVHYHTCCRTGCKTFGKWNFNSRSIISKTSERKSISR